MAPSIAATIGLNVERLHGVTACTDQLNEASSPVCSPHAPGFECTGEMDVATLFKVKKSYGLASHHLLQTNHLGIRHSVPCLMPARVVEAMGDQVMHALPAHVGEVHRWAGRMLRVHFAHRAS